MEMKRGTERSLSPRREKTCYLDWRACELHLGNEGEKERAMMLKSGSVFIHGSICSHTHEGVDAEERFQSWHFFEIFSLHYKEFWARFRARAGEVFGRRKARGWEVVEVKAGKGCLHYLQGSWSSLLEGPAAEVAGGPGYGLPCGHPSWERQQARQGKQEILCLQDFWFSSSSRLWRLTETSDRTEYGTYSYGCSKHQRVRRRNWSWSDFVIICSTSPGMHAKCSIDTVTFVFQDAKSRYTANRLEESVGYSKSEEIWSHKFSLKATLSCCDPALGGEGKMQRPPVLVFSPLPRWTSGCCIPK